MFYVICPTCEARVKVYTPPVRPDRTDVWNVVQCEECDAGFDYDAGDVCSDRQQHS